MYGIELFEDRFYQKFIRFLNIIPQMFIRTLRTVSQNIKKIRYIKKVVNKDYIEKV